MITPQEGEWVLMTHPSMRNSYVVRQVVKVNNKMSDFAHHLPEREIERRKNDAIIAVFENEQLAREAPAILQRLHTQLIRDERALREAHHQAAKSLTHVRR